MAALINSTSVYTLVSSIGFLLDIKHVLLSDNFNSLNRTSYTPYFECGFEHECNF